MACSGLTDAGATNKSRLDRIAVKIESGSEAEARIDLLQYVKDYPEDELAWTILGHLEENADRDDDAERAYQKALAINPRAHQAVTGMGILYRKRGEYDKAMQTYQNAVAIDPNYAQAYSSMAVISLLQYDDDKALESAERSYQLDDSDPVIAANLAIVYHYNNNIAQRDALAAEARRLGYERMDTLDQIFRGEISLRD